jgi:hypothetical protein
MTSSFFGISCSPAAGQPARPSADVIATTPRYRPAMVVFNVKDRESRNISARYNRSNTYAFDVTIVITS